MPSGTRGRRSRTALPAVPSAAGARGRTATYCSDTLDPRVLKRAARNDAIESSMKDWANRATASICGAVPRARMSGELSRVDAPTASGAQAPNMCLSRLRSWSKERSRQPLSWRSLSSRSISVPTWHSVSMTSSDVQEEAGEEAEAEEAEEGGAAAAPCAAGESSSASRRTWSRHSASCIRAPPACQALRTASRDLVTYAMRTLSGSDPLITCGDRRMATACASGVAKLTKPNPCSSPVPLSSGTYTSRRGPNCLK
mmetsp:Transcript_11958/g.39958  ORF Transcript_11958/g.39958 Transcript_11958/m.39958 type:complete len:256 (+) Transcript_11958:794-1561(+)